MITIKRIQEENKQEINFLAQEKDSVLCSAKACLNGTDVEIYKLEGDAFLFDGIIRAVLNCAEKEGAVRAFFVCGHEEKIEKLGYINKLDINKFFNSKNCKKSL